MQALKRSGPNQISEAQEDKLNLCIFHGFTNAMQDKVLLHPLMTRCMRFTSFVITVLIQVDLRLQDKTVLNEGNSVFSFLISGFQRLTIQDLG